MKLSMCLAASILALSMSSISAFAQTGNGPGNNGAPTEESSKCDVARLDVYSDNKLSTEQREDIESRVTDKGYSLNTLGSKKGLVLSLGLQRQPGYYRTQKHNLFHPRIIGIKSLVDNTYSNLFNIVADAKDGYKSVTMKSAKISSVMSCEILYQNCETLHETKKINLELLTSKSKNHDLKVIDWAIDELPECN